MTARSGRPLSPAGRGTPGDPPRPDRLLSAAGLRDALGADLPLYLFVIACNVLSLLASAGAAVASAWAVSAALLGRAASDLAGPVILTLAALALRSLFSWLESWLGHDLSFRMMSTLRGRIFGGIARLAPYGLGRRRMGDVATSALTDSEALEVFYAHSSIYIASAVVTTPLLWGWLAWVSPAAALATLPVLAVAVGITLAMRRSARRTGAAIRAVVAELGSEVGESVGAIREITGFGLVDERLARVRALDVRLAALQQRNIRRAGIETAVGGVASVLCVLLTAAALAGEAASSPEQLLWLAPAMTLAGAVPAPILQWIGVTKHYGTVREAAGRIERLLHTPSPVDRSGTAPLAPATPELATNHVTFRWSLEHTAPTLDEVSVRIPAGASLAIAGRSGAGKSTLAALLSHFVEPGSGQVLLDGVPLPRIAPDAFADAVCTVPQDAYVFAGSIRQNLQLATDRPLADDAFWAALDAAGAAALVHNLPGRLDAAVGEGGTGLSGGESQRLALARALVRDPRVLILDEAVSQLDVRSEQEVSAAVAGREAGRTTVVIAHRLSTLLSAQEILVLHAGRVVARGPHLALLGRSPHYRDLVRNQLRS